MRESTAQLRDVLASGSFDVQWLADVYYAGARRMANIPITAPSFTDDRTAKVQGSGSTTVVWSSDFEASLTPRAASDMLAPFGAELSVAVLITVGNFTSRVQMGWYRIDEVPSAVDHLEQFGRRLISVGSTVELKLMDRMRKTEKDRFDVPSSPPQTQSVLTEVQRITGFQIVRELPDGPIPGSFAYEEERLDPLYDLVALIDGEPYMRPDGSIGQRPLDWPATTDVLTDGPDGTILSVGNSMSAEKVYNRVAVRSSASDGSDVQILGSAQITEGPLRAVNPDGSPSPYGRVTYYYSSDFITTQEQANAYAAQLLPRVSSLRAREVPVEEVFNPLRQVGDVLEVRQAGRDAVVGRVKTIDRDESATQRMTLEVQ
jgi:hypothetical protein